MISSYMPVARAFLRICIALATLANILFCNTKGNEDNDNIVNIRNGNDPIDEAITTWGRRIMQQVCRRINWACCMTLKLNKIKRKWSLLKITQ